MRGHNHDACKVWQNGQKGDLSITWAPHFLPSFAVSPILSMTSLYFSPHPLLLASLCLSLSLSPLFLILHIFPFPVLPQHTLSHSPLLSLSYSPPQSSSALAVSSSPRCTLFFNRGGGWARYRESRGERGRMGGGGHHLHNHPRQADPAARPTLASLSVPQPPLTMPNILCVI